MPGARPNRPRRRVFSTAQNLTLIYLSRGVHRITLFSGTEATPLGLPRYTFGC